MSVNMYWKPVKPIKETCFASGSTLYKYMENAFGILPVNLRKVLMQNAGWIGRNHENL